MAKLVHSLVVEVLFVCLFVKNRTGFLEIYKSSETDYDINDGIREGKFPLGF